MKTPFIYRHAYNLTACGLEKLHPFDSIKYKRVFNALVNKGVIKGLEDVY